MRRITSLLLPLALTLLAACAAHAQAPSDDAPDAGGRWVVLPNVFSTPETGLAGGVAAIHFFDLAGATDATPSSHVTGLLIYTEKNQLIASLAPQLYLHGDALRVEGNAEYVRFPDLFYGIGNDVPDEGEDFTTTTVSAGAAGLWRLRPGLYAGPSVLVQDQRLSDLEEGGLLAAGGVAGADGGRTVGIGARLQWDHRDRPTYPTHGTYADVNLRLSQGAWGSDFDFSRVDVDLRAFRPAVRGHVLALQGYGAVAGGTVPFTLLPQLGGANQLRGYYAGRFRDHAYVTAQAEYRVPTFWWRLGASAFAGVGQVADGLTALPDAPVRWAVGGGLRVALSRAERLNIRIDYGIGPDTSNLYITLGEAF